MFLEALAIVCAPMAALCLIALVYMERQIVSIHDRLEDLEAKTKLIDIEADDPVKELGKLKKRTD